MSTRKRRSLPARLEGLRRRFERWRRTRKVRNQLQVLFQAGNPDAAQAAPAWRAVGPRV